jgi:hypothetical protein
MPWHSAIENDDLDDDDDDEDEDDNEGTYNRRIRPLKTAPLTCPPSLTFNYTQGPAVAHNSADELHFCEDNRDAYRPAKGRVPDAGEKFNRDTLLDLTRKANAESLMAVGGGGAVGAGVEALHHIENSDHEAAADASLRAASIHQELARKAEDDGNESLANDHRLAGRAHMKQYRRLKGRLTGNVRIRPTGGDPLPLTASCVFNYGPEPVCMNAGEDRHAFDAAPGTDLMGSGGSWSGGDEYLDEREQRPSKIRKVRTGVGQVAGEPQSIAASSA